MVRSTQLGNCVSQVLGIKPTSVASHVRNLREAGLITKAGRGITGAIMTPRDAAHLIIAATASQDVQDSVDTVSLYGLLPNGGLWTTIPVLKSLDRTHTFVDALSAFLTAETIQYLAGDPKFSASFTFDYPHPCVTVEARVRDTTYERIYKMPWQPKKRVTSQKGDRNIRIRISEQTVFVVGNLLSGIGH